MGHRNKHGPLDDLRLATANQSMKPTQPLALRLQRNSHFCFKWLGGSALSR